MRRGTYCSVSNKLGQGWEFRKERISQRMFSDNRPVVLRKRRFTRKQRKSVSIEPETGLILAVGTAVNGKYSSSDEDDIGKTARQPASSKSNGHLPEGQLNSNSEIDPTRFKQQAAAKRVPRGPSARRATRHLRSKFANSTGDLAVMDSITPIRAQPRSLSVRNLNGEQFDFGNQDAVTRWTSQILAEISSLPSSCVDLTKQQQQQTRSDRESPFAPLRRQLPPPSVQIPSYSPMSCSLTSSYHSSAPWMSTNDNNRMTSSQIMYSSINTDSLIDDLTASVHSSSSEMTMRDRENSVNTSTIVASSNEATPKAVSLEELNNTERKEEGSQTVLDENVTTNKDSFNSTKMPVFNQSPYSPSAWMTPPNKAPPSLKRLTPIPNSAKRTTVPAADRPTDSEMERNQTGQRVEKEKINGGEGEQSNGSNSNGESDKNDVKFRKFDPLEAADERLRRSIAKMSQSVYGDSREKQAKLIFIFEFETSSFSDSRSLFVGELDRQGLGSK
ncbi:hypothetical protein WR25_14731 isoform C [Diploscapter pachys]|uniref:Uncharacterized protein n=1 Tax=Diploscapter pachys TaxID=2018661 RepID=A0A2A2J9N2_9BILA|nr:hypothetical protein WR25_14731 isoform B [Diploscapter pachys]PAV58345.1 hypothetical protein WR25_14731 isoform C [Diploscapter pachys]